MTASSILTLVLLVTVAVIAAGLLIGTWLGGPDPGNREALASVTVSRHRAIALMLAAGNGMIRHPQELPFEGDCPTGDHPQVPRPAPAAAASLAHPVNGAHPACDCQVSVSGSASSRSPQ